MHDKELYNLKSDPGESKNVMAEHPETVKKLRAVMDEFKTDIVVNGREVGRYENPKTPHPIPGFGPGGLPGFENLDPYMPTLKAPKRPRGKEYHAALEAAGIIGAERVAR